MFRVALIATLMILGVGIGGCTTSARLAYSPSTSVDRSSAPAIFAVGAVDQRKEAPHRLATIMGGFGNPLKYLDTADPVKDVVAGAFVDGLQARGLLSEDHHAPFRLDLVIRKFDADMIMGSTARIDMDLTLVNAGTSQPVYRDTIADERSDFAFFAVGVFASTDDLQKLAQTLLNATVDKMLDKPGFRAALTQISAPSQAAS